MNEAFFDELVKIAISVEELQRVVADQPVIKAPARTGPELMYDPELGATRAVPGGFVRQTKGRVGRLSPQSQKALNLLARHHEMSEGRLGIGGGIQMSPTTGEPVLRTPGHHAFMETHGHADPDVILRERNVARTLPKPVREEVSGAMQRVRSASGLHGSDTELLEEATRGVKGKGLEYGSGPRLSRHARKKISKRMAELAGQRMAASEAEMRVIAPTSPHLWERQYDPLITARTRRQARQRLKSRVTKPLKQRMRSLPWARRFARTVI